MGRLGTWGHPRILFLGHLLVALIFSLQTIAPVRADDIARRSAFYASTPIIDSTMPSLLDEMSADMPVLKSKGVVFTPVSATSHPYAQAGYEIDFAHSKFTPQTRALALQWQKTRNYFAVRGQFQKCGLPVDNRKLDQRILAAAQQVQLPQMSCQTLMNETDPRFIQLAKVNQAFVSSQLEDLVIMKALQSAGQAYGYAKKRYPGSSSNDLCGASGSWFETGYAHEECTGKVFETLSKAIQEGGEGVKPISAGQLRSELNSRINAMNHALGQIKTTDLNAAWNPFTHPNITPDVQEKYNQYVLTYDFAAAAPDGDLLLTGKVQKETGQMRSLEKDGGNHHGVVTWPSHSAIDESGLSAGIQEDRDDLRMQMSMLNDLYINKKNVEGYGATPRVYRGAEENFADLKNLIKDNPVAVGQALMEFPQAASTICEVINQIEQEDARAKTRDKYFAVGLGIAGGALVLTGVGSAAGVWLLGGAEAVAAGGAAATLATVTTLSALAGTTLGIGSTGFYATRTYNAYKDYEHLEQSVLSHTGDDKTRQEADEALTEFASLRRHAILSGVLSVTDLAALGSMAKSADGLLGLRLMKQTVEDAQKASLTSRAINGLFTQIGKVVGEDNMAAGLKVFSEASENLRVRLLEKLAKSSPKQWRDLFEQALALGRKTCGA